MYTYMCRFYSTKKSTSAIKWPRDKTFRSLVAASSLLSLFSLYLLRNGNSRKTSRIRITLMTLFRLESLLFFFFFLFSIFFSFSLLLSLAKQDFFYSVVNFLLLLQVYTIHLHLIRILCISSIYFF
jgi:hypothetical protein